MATASEENQELSHIESDDVTLQKEIVPTDDVSDDERTAGHRQDEVDTGQTCTIMGRPVQGPMAIGNISAPVNFGGPQEIAINTTNNNIGQQNSTYIRKQVTNNNFISQNCLSCHGSASVSETEDDEAWKAPRVDIRDVSPEVVSRAVELLDQNRRVALCGPPGSGKSSLGHAILTHYHHRGFKAYVTNKLCCQNQQSFCKKKQTILLLDGGLGVVRLDSDQYYRCQDLITNTQCLLVLSVYPHLLRDMAVLKTRRPLLPSSLIIDMKPRPHVGFNLSVMDYLPLFQHMLHDPNFGHLVAALFALSMLGRYSLESDPPELTSDLQRLGFHGVDHYHLKQLAYNFRGSFLPETGPGFASRLLYDAAGLALGSLHSTSVLLQVCDVTFLVQHVRTSGESHDSLILLGRDRSVLMQRMYELILDGQMPVLCLHPSLSCPEFLKDFEEFLTSHKNYLHRVVSAVDREHGLPLLYWSVWSPSPHLTRWCLTVTLQQVGESQVLPLLFFSAAFAVLFTETDIDTRVKAKQIMMKCNSLVTKYTAFELPFSSKLFTQEIQATVSGIKTRLRTCMSYLDDPSLPIPATLLSVTVTEDAVSVELPSQHWYLTLRLLADREVDETDRDGNTLLHIAADKGNLEAITLAVKSGASLTKTNNKGLTPYQLALRPDKKDYGFFSYMTYARYSFLDYQAVQFIDRITRDLYGAISRGDKVSVKTLLCYKNTVHDDDFGGKTALIAACEAGQSNIANMLIELGADVNVKGRYNRIDALTALQHACCNGLTGTVELLLKHHADINARNKGGKTALYYAYTSERPGIITQLIKAGAETARVHLAVVRGDVDALMTLLQQGADVNQHDTSMGCSPLHAACLMGRTDIVTCLTQHGAKVDDVDDMKRTPLHCACVAGHTQVAQQLVDEGADVNARDKSQSSPLYEAALNGNTELSLCLIEHGAQVDAANEYDPTPLHAACKNGHTETTHCLLQHGAKVNAVSEVYVAPLHAACKNGHTKTAECLLQHGANVNAVSEKYGTPLHAACENGHTETAQCLLQHGANVNAVSERYGTPLHKACENGHTHMAHCLLQHKANVNAASRFNGTPLHSACKNGHTQTAQCLLQHGADVNAVSRGRGTPLDLARENAQHCDDMVKLLVQEGAVSRDQVTQKTTAA